MTSRRVVKYAGITDVNNEYIRQCSMEYSVIEGEWTDAGTFDSLLRAGLIVQKQQVLKKS